MTAANANKSPIDVRNIHIDRAIRQVHALRAKARLIRPGRAARLLGTAEAISGVIA